MRCTRGEGTQCSKYWSEEVKVLKRQIRDDTNTATTSKVRRVECETRKYRKSKEKVCEVKMRAGVRPRKNASKNFKIRGYSERLGMMCEDAL